MFLIKERVCKNSLIFLKNKKKQNFFLKNQTLLPTRFIGTGLYKILYASSHIPLNIPHRAWEHSNHPSKVSTITLRLYSITTWRKTESNSAFSAVLRTSSPYPHSYLAGLTRKTSVYLRIVQCF